MLGGYPDTRTTRVRVPEEAGTQRRVRVPDLKKKLVKDTAVLGATLLLILL